MAACVQGAGAHPGGVIGAAAGVVLIGLTSGCAVYPKQAAIEKFAAGATTAAAGAREALAIHYKIADDLANVEAALAYVSGDAFSFPPEDTVSRLPQEVWRARLDAVSAISDYAAELAAIGKPGAAQAAGAAAANLAGKTIALGKATGIEVASGLASGAPAIASSIVTFAFDYALAVKMRRVMVKTNDTVKEAARVLAEDTGALASVVRGDIAILSGAREQELRAIRRDRRIDRIALHDHFMATTAADSASRSLIARYAAVVASITAMAEAHDALVHSRDEDRAVADFLQTTQALLAGAKAVAGQ